MDEKRKEEEARELTPEEIDDMIFEEQIASGEHNEKVPEYYFSNPDPYAKIEPRPDDAPKRDLRPLRGCNGSPFPRGSCRGR